MRKYWNLQVPRRKLVSILLTIVPPVSVFFILRSVLLDQILENTLAEQRTMLLAKGVYLTALTVFALIGGFSLQKIERRKLFIITLAYRLVAITTIMVFQRGSLVYIPCVLLGSSFGVGFPSDLAFLSDNTELDERGKVAGLALCVTFFTVVVYMILSSGLEFSMRENMLACLLLQTISGGALVLNQSWDIPNRITISINSLLENKTFLLYMTPWIMFSFVNGAVEFLWQQMLDTYELRPGAMIAQYLASIIFFIVAGIISDYYGRKPTLLIGFVMLGFSYFLVPSIESIVIDYTVSVFSGIAWSFILVSFLFTIVGDISPRGGREAYFAISGLFWMVIETGFTFFSSLVTLNIQIGIVSSILSLVMFLAVIPLLSINETLPRNKISDRRISDYFERVLKTLEERDD